eukprot:CAMPEP_0197041218 /NCGR_PEP_ID=MMETSP1384-20130603/17796_1 /TAXON_ID=29189 /ORGANISM="Ammonia sp." /LENGTH=491 /DNA_ID=CAMNT_0042472099 /DNA_START=36 /DNA_END=1511 /DNA_ORIENTATION=-
MTQTTDTTKEAPNEEQQREKWKVGSPCLIYSRSENRWYDAKITKIINEGGDEKTVEEEKQAALTQEWLIVNYKNGKKNKRIQRKCQDIKPIPSDHILSLKKGSICLIYSSIIKLWCEGKVISVFTDEDGEWLKVKYWDTNEHKICEIQRYSPELQTFKRHLLWTPMVKLAVPSKPWQSLETNHVILPFRLSNTVKLSDNEFMVAGYSFDADNDAAAAEAEAQEEAEAEPDEEQEPNGIYKYDVDKNRWSLFIKYPAEFFSQYHNICIDDSRHIIYLFNGAAGSNRLWKIDIETHKFECIELSRTYWGSLSYLVNGQCHLFWGHQNDAHLRWNDNASKFEVVHQFANLANGMMSFGMVYNHKEQYFLLFGGYKGKEAGRSDAIWKYSMNEQEWQKLKVRMPQKMQSFASVVTDDCQFALIIGGSNDEGLSDKIYILNLGSMQWKLSNVVCPTQGIGYNNVIIMKDKKSIQYVHVLQGMYSHIIAPLHDILYG